MENKNTDTVKERINELTIQLRKGMRDKGGYRELTELEKIPFRCMAAEILVLEEVLSKGDTDFDEWICRHIDKENYCGAEGIKRAKEWLNNHQSKIITNEHR